MSFLKLVLMGVITTSVATASMIGSEDGATKPIYPYDQWPAWSPDGKRLVFVSNRNLWGDTMAPTTLWAANVDGSTPTQLILRYRLDYPAWSQDGKRLAFNGGGNIYVFDLETRKAYPLFTGSGHGYYPSWRPDGRALTFSAQRKDDSDIYIAELNPEGPQILKRERLVIHMPGADRQPVWSPDGRWIAFVHTWQVGTEDVTDEIYVVRPDGSGLKKVCRLVPRHNVERLHWLADNNHLLVCQMRGGFSVGVDLLDEKPADLLSHNRFIQEQEKVDSQYIDSVPSEESVKVLRKYGGYYEEIEGKYLVFRYKFDEQGNIVNDPQNKIVDISTGEVKDLMLPYGRKGAPPHPVGAGQVAVSPDGKRIAFMSNSSDYPNTFGTSIWVANLDGSEPREVTKPPQPLDPEIPILTRLDPNFPVPLSSKVGNRIALEVALFHPSGWEAVKEVQFRFTRTGAKSTSFSIQFERAANVLRLLDANGKPVEPPVKPSGAGRATAQGVTLMGERSVIKAGKKVATIQVAFVVTAPTFSGEWSIQVRAQDISGKTNGWQQMGWLTLHGR